MDSNAKIKLWKTNLLWIKTACAREYWWLRLTETSSALHISFNYVLCTLPLKSWEFGFFLFIQYKCKTWKRWLFSVYITVALQFLTAPTFWDWWFLFFSGMLIFIFPFLLWAAFFVDYMINWTTPLFTACSE